MKSVLVVYYSQTGQLKRVLDRVCEPLKDSNKYELDYYELEMENEYPFPWKKEEFFGVFPESFKQLEQPFFPPKDSILNKKYDLIILGYQVWYLTPSIPINSFLKSEIAQRLLCDTPIITISGTRNMWVMAQEKVKELLIQCKGKLVGNIALVDRNVNLVSVVTIVDWMFTGLQRKLYGIFPKPGISPEEIEDSIRFGKTIQNHLDSGDYIELQTNLVAQGAVEIRHFLVSMDKKANRLFSIWSNLILNSKAEKRSFLLKCFNVYLLVAIWLISPIVHLIHLITYPINYKKIRRDKTYFEGVK